MATKEVWVGNVGPWEYDDAEDYADQDEVPTGITYKGLRTTGCILADETVDCSTIVADTLTVSSISVAGTLGTNSVVNGTFDEDDHWTKGAGWTIAGGVAVATTAGGSLSETIGTAVIGKWYKVKYDITVTSGSYRLYCGTNYSPYRSLTATNAVWYFKAKSTSALSFIGYTLTGTLDNVSMQEVDDISLFDEVLIGNTSGEPVMITGGLNVGNCFVLDDNGHLILANTYTNPVVDYMLSVKGTTGMNGVYVSTTDRYAMQAANSGAYPAGYFDNTGTSPAFWASIGRTANNTVEDAIYFLKYDREAGHYGAVGMGVGIRFDLEDGGGTNDQAARIAAVWTDVTAGTEKSDIVFSPRKTTGLAEVMRITGDGRVGINRSPGYSLDVEGSFRVYRTGSDAYMYFVAATNAAYIYMTRPAGQYGLIQMQSAGSNRWTFGVSNAAEAGGDVGSDFQINRYSDAGAWIANALGINRASGDVSIAAVANASRFVSSIATGTQPFACTSTTANTNLNADMVDGKHASEVACPGAWGDGADGTVTISVDTVLSSDRYYLDLTVNAGIKLDCNGWRVFVKNTLTNSGTIHVNGANGGYGGAGSGTVGGSGGSGASGRTGNTVQGSLAGKAGTTGGNGSVDGADGITGTVGTNGNAESASAGGASGVGGGTGAAGGDTASYTGGGTSTGGVGGGVTTLGARMRNYADASSWSVHKTGGVYSPNFNGGSGGSGSGGGGASEAAGDSGGGGGGSGGGGANAGCMLVCARTLVNNGTISAVGGTGGNGGSGGDGYSGGTGAGGGGGGAGGSGGSGGLVVIVTTSYTGANPSISGGAGGSGGGGGLGSGAGNAGGDGASGVDGTSGTYVILTM